MLSHIYIKNIAIIREINIDLEDGLTILSGETGTGKSIVIQAIELALGGRSSTSIIGSSGDKAIVQLVFHINDYERDLAGRFADPEDDTLILTRELSRNRGSLARVNDEIVRLSELSALASGLIDVHGQYDNQFFLDPRRHLDILDDYAHDQTEPILSELRPAYETYRSAREELLTFRKNRSEYLRRMDFMHFELDEIRAAEPLPGEDAALEDKVRLLKNNERVLDALNETYEILYDSKLETCAEKLEGIAGLDPAYEALSASMSDLAYGLQDLKEDVRRERDRAVFAPGELDAVMQRLDILDNLKRKYGGTLESVLAHENLCRRELEFAPDAEDAEKQLQDQYAASARRVSEISRRLSNVRKTAATELERRMVAELRDLNFSSVEFEVRFEETTDDSGHRKLTARGFDDICFMFNANRGAELKPLSDIASGGEISRISLAFKNISTGSDRIGTMIFDEIDTGISGRTASAAAARLRRIGRDHQILCITHLPQIAASGHHHCLISKEDDDAGSYTMIRNLSPEERTEEIARLLGGSNITETTLRSASELIASFEDSDGN